MDTIKASVPQTKPNSKRFETPEDIWGGECPDPECRNPLYVTSRHIGGHMGKVPFVACSNLDGGEAHFLQRISEELFFEYIDFVVDREQANEAWVTRLTEQFEEARE